MGVKVILETYENGQKVQDVFDLWFSDDQFRNASGIAGGMAIGAVGAFLGGLVGSKFGPEGMKKGAIAGGLAGGEVGDDLGKYLYDELHKWYEPLSEEEKQAWREKGYIPFSPNDPQNFDPTRPLDPHLNDLYLAAKNFTPPRRDPLVLDLDGDGIETLGITSTSQVLFDYDGDGVKTGTGWIKGDDGFVVLDRNGNGTIDNGGELFGDQTLVNGAKASDGFSALSAEDTNHDGTFDADDANYTNVRVWQDTNSDGISQTSELHTLTELGIASINLTSTETNTATNGNTQSAASTYTRTDGTTDEAGNLNFSQNSFYREFTDPLPLTDTALALPDMQGSGMVRDLREASTLSVGLTSTLQTMRKTYETHDEMMVQVDTLLAQWAGTSSMATSVNNQNFKNTRRMA